MASKYVSPICPACGEMVQGEGILIGKVKVQAPLTQEGYDHRHNFHWQSANGRVGYSTFEFTATAQDYKRNVYHEDCVYIP